MKASASAASRVVRMAVLKRDILGLSVNGRGGSACTRAAGAGETRPYGELVRQICDLPILHLDGAAGMGSDAFIVGDQEQGVALLVELGEQFQDFGAGV